MNRKTFTVNRETKNVAVRFIAQKNINVALRFIWTEIE